jgi:hypothetical protein
MEANYKKCYYLHIRKQQDIMVDEMYILLALFMLLKILEKPTHRSYYSKNLLTFTPSCSGMLPLTKPKLII